MLYSDLETAKYLNLVCKLIQNELSSKYLAQNLSTTIIILNKWKSEKNYKHNKKNMSSFLFDFWRMEVLLFLGLEKLEYFNCFPNSYKMNWVTQDLCNTAIILNKWKSEKHNRQDEKYMSSFLFDLCRMEVSLFPDLVLGKVVLLGPISQHVISWVTDC